VRSVIFATHATLFFLYSLFLSNLATAAGCEQQDSYYPQAVELSSKQDHLAAKQQLEKSVAICSVYNNWYLYGRTLQQLEQYDQALSAYEKAKTLADSDNQKAIAIARYAEVLSLTGKKYEALSLLQAAKKMHASPRQWMIDLMFKLDKELAGKPMTKELVTRSLGSHQFGMLSADSKPAVNLRINFEFDSTAVDHTSEQNLEALAAALTEGSYGDKHFRLIGHTDTRGEGRYNDKLSKQRAVAVQAYLETIRPELKGRMYTEGAGKSKPLYKGNSEEEHRLNRRLEVVIE